MRHIGSLVLSLVLAPAIWLLVGTGLLKYNNARAAFESGVRVEALLGLAALATAGTLVAVLIVPRLSPVGPALAGLVFLGMAGWATLHPQSLYQALPRTFLGVDGAWSYPASYGHAALLAVPLLATALSPRRWRRLDVSPVPPPAVAAPAGHQNTVAGSVPPPATEPLSQVYPPSADGDQTTTRLSVPGSRPRANPLPTRPVPGRTDAQRALPDSPPPPAAYPPPGHTAPTAPPVDPEATQRL